MKGLENKRQIKPQFVCTEMSFWCEIYKFVPFTFI